MVFFEPSRVDSYPRLTRGTRRHESFLHSGSSQGFGSRQRESFRLFATTASPHRGPRDPTLSHQLVVPEPAHAQRRARRGAPGVHPSVHCGCRGCGSRSARASQSRGRQQLCRPAQRDCAVRPDVGSHDRCGNGIIVQESQRRHSYLYGDAHDPARCYFGVGE